MAGRKKPTALLVPNAFKKNPDRARNNEPQTPPLGDAPFHFSKKQRMIWDEIKSTAADGVLQQSDSFAIEDMVYLIEEKRDCPKAFQSAKYTILVKLYAKFGLTASDRASLEVPKKENKKTTYKDM